MKTYTFYFPNGTISGSTVCSEEELEFNLRADQEYVEGFFDPEHLFIVDGIATNKQEMEITLDGRTISCVPLGSTITIEGTNYDVTEETVELDPVFPGPYHIRISKVGYYDKELVIE